ncbi:MAG TPA: sigma-70 family RNA polymerase sigma factor [Candidatus Dormibacteraeota bacterium]|nr:sigma-70 family RNA polymerase sigma factor [Candidatus Dormibacteraeota bacterium]
MTRDTGFERLFRSEYPRVVAVAARILLDEAAAEDVAQDVFLAFHRSQDPAAPHAPGWLRAAAAHAALNQLRSQRRRAARELKVTAAPVAMDPADRVGIAESRAAVRGALGRMRRRHATVLALRYSGLSYAEVADAMGVRVNQVGTLLRRAEGALRKEIGDASL